MIDVSGQVAADPDFLLTPEHIQAWEGEHGRIPSGAWVLLRTDWSKRTDAQEFLNIREDGPHSPGFDKTASEFLARERDILGVGVETVGTDAGQAGRFDPPFPNHTIMHGPRLLDGRPKTEDECLPSSVVRQTWNERTIACTIASCKTIEPQRSQSKKTNLGVRCDLCGSTHMPLAIRMQIAHALSHRGHREKDALARRPLCPLWLNWHVFWKRLSYDAGSIGSVE